MGDAAQHAGIFVTVGAEEYLVLPENTRHAVDGNLLVVEDVYIVAPELVLDKERHFGLSEADEFPRVQWRVERQVAHHVGSFVILAHFVARWREEREQDALLGVFAPQPFHEGASLFELAKGGGVKPHVASVAYLAAQDAPGVPMAAYEQAGLAVEQRDHAST